MSAVDDMLGRSPPDHFPFDRYEKACAVTHETGL